MDEINSINSMLIECVKALGGSKVVASKLWPEKSIDVAQRLLLASLNEDRPEKLTPDQAYLIEKLARDIGCHVAIEFRCKDMSYTIPSPIKPVDAKEILQQKFIDAVNQVNELAGSLKSLGVINE
jgi:hypothetical protein